MDRRGFLGRVLGVIAGSQIPWVAREFDPEFDLIGNIGKAKKLSPLRTAVRLMDGTLLEGPGLKDVKPIEGKIPDVYEYFNKVYTFQPIECREQMVVKSAVLMQPNGEILAENDFHYTDGLFMRPGDTLKITHTLSFDGTPEPGDEHYLG